MMKLDVRAWLISALALAAGGTAERTRTAARPADKRGRDALQSLQR